MTQGDAAMSVRVAPGRWPLLGHTPALLLRRFGFTEGLRALGDLVTESVKFEKGAMFDKFRPFVGNGIVNSGGAFHLRQRRLIQPAFHHDRIARYAETMHTEFAALSGSWRSGEIREINEDMQALAVTIVGAALFGAELGKPAIEEARRSIPVVVRQGMIRALSPELVGKLLVRGNRKFDQAVRRMRAVVGQLIDDWHADGVDRGDLLSAGIETSALALAWLFHEIARHPEVARRVHEEIDQVLAGRPVTGDDTLGGVRLPAGTEVTTSPHALHHDPRSFADPTSFDPDRWAPDRVRDVPRGAFIPFGAGTRQCVGNTFAQLEMAVTVVTIASRWRLVPMPDRPLEVAYTSTAYPTRLSMTVVSRWADRMVG
jgi:cytochrome P450